MLTLSASCVSIALADKAGTLTMVERPDRFGGTYIAIGDDHGVIEVALSWDEANQRLAALRERAA